MSMVNILIHSERRFLDRQGVMPSIEIGHLVAKEKWHAHKQVRHIDENVLGAEYVPADPFVNFGRYDPSDNLARRFVAI